MASKGVSERNNTPGLSGCDASVRPERGRHRAQGREGGAALTSAIQKQKLRGSAGIGPYVWFSRCTTHGAAPRWSCSTKLRQNIISVSLLGTSGGGRGRAGDGSRLAAVVAAAAASAGAEVDGKGEDAREDVA